MHETMSHCKCGPAMVLVASTLHKHNKQTELLINAAFALTENEHTTCHGTAIGEHPNERSITWAYVPSGLCGQKHGAMGHNLWITLESSL